MNDIAISNRNKTLLIVEGHHEKNKFFSLMFWCFHEFNIKMENVWIYGTSIYQLYDDIVKEYGDACFENQDDIDLPFVLSKKKSLQKIQYKTNYTNIIIVFDYERHDPAFSEKKISEMQATFNDPTDMGKLYINYPMIESAYHVTQIPDEGYNSRTCIANIRKGSEYKNLVKKESCIKWEFELLSKLDDYLCKNYELLDDILRDDCCKELLDLPDDHIRTELIDSVLSKYLTEYDSSLKYQAVAWIKQSKHYGHNLGYKQYMRNLFQLIAGLNVKKAFYIQTGKETSEKDKQLDIFNEIDLQKVLHKQNDFSRENGLIWVLCTAILFVADYNTKLLIAG